jgi:hypothetical protein
MGSASPQPPPTTEGEITEPTNLALSDGITLNPAAKGWSRRPLLKANLHGRWGRTKRWDYLAFLSEEVVVSVVYADVDYLGLAEIWWVHLPSGRTGGNGIAAPLSRGIALPELPGSEPLQAKGRGLELSIATAENGSVEVNARWRERDGRLGEFTGTMDQPPGHESLNVVIPWSDTLYQYTSKHQARPGTGSLLIGDERFVFGPTHPHLGFGVIDIGRGRWPYRTRWNWGGAAGSSVDGHHQLGLQLGGKWTVGTGYTENGLLVDGRLIKLGAELDWFYDWDHPMRPWSVSDPNGWLKATLIPRFDKHSRLNAGVAATETHQVFGHWSGRLRAESGEDIEFRGLIGFAEESRSRW